MENNNENGNSSNAENPHADLLSLDVDALREVAIKERTTRGELEGKNRQLFERAKKAEGFEKDEEGNWTKVVEKPRVGRPPKEPEAAPKQSDGMDYGAKAFLMQKGIQPDEFGWVQEQMEESGIKDIEKLIDNGYFKSNLQSRRDQKAIESAAPGSTRGTGESAKTTPEYWVQKGELPPDTPENFELRTKVLDLRLAREKSGNQFNGSSVIYSGSAPN